MLELFGVCVETQTQRARELCSASHPSRPPLKKERKQTRSGPISCNETHFKVCSEAVGVDVKVTFWNWSCFLLRQRGEISQHPHKETLLARLLTRHTSQQQGDQKKYAQLRRREHKLVLTFYLSSYSVMCSDMVSEWLALSFVTVFLRVVITSTRGERAAAG